MLKKTFLLLGTLFVLTFENQTLKAQDDVIDKIATETCDCVKDLDFNLPTDQLQMQFGLCILKVAQPYQKELKKSYNIDLNNIDGKYGEELGRLVGLKMVAVCPEYLVKLSGMEQNEDESNATEKVFRGKVISIDENQFVTFQVENQDGKTSKFIWLKFFPMSKDLESKYKKLVDKEVEVYYTEDEYYDPRIIEYKTFKIISNFVII
jgi:hypothetical protein